MKLNKFFIAGAMGAVLMMNISCADDYKELNQDPANVTKTMPEGLMTAARVIAAACICTMLRPGLVEKARALTLERNGGRYECPLPDSVQPPIDRY